MVKSQGTRWRPEPKRASDGRHRCLRCDCLFVPGRRDKAFCGRSCQQNHSRGSRAGKESADQRRTNELDWDALQRLNLTFYGSPRGKRMELIRSWLDQARQGDTVLRRVLGKPRFRLELAAHHKERPAFPSVPRIADIYCRRYLGTRVWSEVHRKTGPRQRVAQEIFEDWTRFMHLLVLEPLRPDSQPSENPETPPA